MFRGSRNYFAGWAVEVQASQSDAAESSALESAAGSVLEPRRDGKLLKLLGNRENDG
jgi:hypothetical protein